MLTKQKICYGCKVLSWIWKNILGKPYCRKCAYEIIPPKKTKPVSKKRAKELKVYNKEREQFLIDKPYCGAKLPGCLSVATDIHHLFSGKNRGEHFLDTETWMGVCRNCHRVIHDELSEEDAKELGLKM